MRRSRQVLQALYPLTNWIEKPAYRRGILRADRLRLPDFLGLGGPQSGTWWLFRCLDAHPGVRMPATKEMHYWDKTPDKPLVLYARLFAPAGPRLTGDITPTYARLPLDEIRFIHRLRPGTKMIYLVRNPVDRDWSSLRRYYARHLGRDLSEVPESEMLAFLDAVPPSPDSTHAANLRRWRSVFPADQVFVGFFDDIGERPRDLLERIFAFLGLDQDIDWAKVPVRDRFNSNPPHGMPDAVRAKLSKRYRGHIDELRTEYPVETADW